MKMQKRFQATGLKEKLFLCFDEFTEGYPTMFSIELHHGGKFTKFPGIRYIEGRVDCVDLVDMDEFSVHELDDMMLKLGYVVPPVIYYHFQLPNRDLDFGLRALGNDADVLNLAQYIKDNKTIKVYTEHGETKLLTYFMSPRTVPSVIIEELECNEENEITQLKPGEYPIVVAKPRSNLPVVDLSHLTQTRMRG